MDTIHIPRNEFTRLIAHRGLSGLETENTVAAFIAAGNRDYFGMETDIHVTSDGRYILIHDNETGRVSSENISVEGSTLEKLRSVRLNNVCDVPRGDLMLPLPEEYLEICARYQKVGVLEFKGRFEREQLQEIRNLVSRYYSEEKMVYISFDYENVCRMRELTATANIQFLCDKLNEEQLRDLAARNIDVDIYYPSLTKENVDRMHELGIKINCWTCDDPEDAQRLIDWGVDYITTNILQYE